MQTVELVVSSLTIPLTLFVDTSHLVNSVSRKSLRIAHSELQTNFVIEKDRGRLSINAGIDFGILGVVVVHGIHLGGF